VFPLSRVVLIVVEISVCDGRAEFPFLFPCKGSEIVFVCHISAKIIILFIINAFLVKKKACVCLAGAHPGEYTLNITRFMAQF
jgi:hypothetical protein